VMLNPFLVRHRTPDRAIQNSDMIQSNHHFPPFLRNFVMVSNPSSIALITHQSSTGDIAISRCVVLATSAMPVALGRTVGHAKDREIVRWSGQPVPALYDSSESSRG
jgi:hypothetical protein